MNILEFPLPFITPPNVYLPHHDEYGWPHGEGYDAFKTARTVRFSTRTTFRGLKFKRRYEALSMNEQRPLFGFAFNPYVIDVRDQYGIYDSAKFNKAVLNGQRMRQTDIMTIDIILTLVLPPDNRIHYHGISIKDAADQLDEADLRRQEREKAALAERGWTWELLRGAQFTKLAFSNHFTMYRCIRETDVFSQYEQARWFADRLLNSSLSGTLGNILARVSKRLNISNDEAHRLFAIGASFGFITLDHTKPLRVDAPLYLIS